MTMRFLAGFLLFAVCADIVGAHDLRGMVQEFEQLSAEERARILQSEEDRAVLVEELRINPEARSLETVLSYASLWKPGSKLTVCFLDGSQSSRANVAAVANEWTRYTNLSFDFGQPGNLSSCSTENPARIRVSFRSNGYWSYVGTDSLYVRGDKPTMGLQNLDSPSVDSTRFRTYVLHEFGHAIGLEHEHQSPRSQCESEFSWDYLTANMGLSRQEIDRNMRRFRDSRAYPSSEYDQRSIMHYSLPAEYFKNPATARCFTSPVSNLSPQDRTGIAEAYPAAAIADRARGPASAPSAMTPMNERILSAVNRIRSRTEQVNRDD